jgi:tetratricopeptide (TPR) repeat protein
VEARSPHFVVVTNGGASWAMRLAQNAELMWSVMAERYRRDAARADAVRILALRSKPEFLRLLPEHAGPHARLEVGGVSFDLPYGREIAMCLDVPGLSPQAVLSHELSHTFAAAAWPDLPGWLDEGLAAFWSTAKMRRGGVLLGLPLERYLRLLESQGLLPMKWLWLREDEEPEERVQHLEAQSWLFAHWLVLGEDGAERDRLDRYIEAPEDAANGPPRWLATDEAQAAETSLRRYLATGSLPRLLVERPSRLGAESATIRELAAHEVDAALGAFLVRRSRPEQARVHLERALAADPELATALEWMGHLRYADGDFAAALSWYSRAMTAGEASELAYDRTVTAVLRLDLREVEPSLVDSYLSRVVSDRPLRTPVWISLAERYASVGALDLAVSACGRAVEARPGSAWLRFMLARSLQAAGHPEDARRAVRAAIDLAAAGSDPVESNNLCWYGGVGGFADVVLPSCEHAVRLRPDQALYRDSRAVVRALQGDRAGAIADLRFFLSSAEADALGLRASRESWLARLERGGNPFDAATLKALVAELPF